MGRSLGVIVLVVATAGGCQTGNQPVEWQRSKPVDYHGAVQVSVTSRAAMPHSELRYIQRDIELRLRRLFRGSDARIVPYQLTVVITTYDEGDSFARFMLAGMGKMELWGEVELKQGNLSVRRGSFEKTYSLGGVVGASAEMHDDMVVKVGEAIAESLGAPED